MKRYVTAPALALFAACSSVGADRALNPPVIDTLPGGIVHVRNTGPTAWTDTNGWKLVQVAAINPPDGSPGELGRVQSLALGDDGTVYAFQSSPATIKAYGPDGTFLRDIGREGDGPGEIRGGMLAIRGDTLVVQDPNAHRLTFLKTDGTFIRTVQSTCCYWVTTLTIDSAGRVWSPGSVGKTGEGGWIRFGMDGAILDTVLMPPTEEGRANGKYWKVEVKNGSNSSSMMMSIPLQPGTWQYLRFDGALLQGNTERLAFAVLRNGKDTAEVFEADAPRLPLSGVARDSAFEAAISNQSEHWRTFPRSGQPGPTSPPTGADSSGCRSPASAAR
jgi:hypothetical protein